MKSAALLVELFTEELPPKTLKRLGDSFAQSVFQSLNQVHLIGANAKLQSFASPRRLALLIEDVVLQAPDHPVREKLLPTSIAFDERGQASAPLQKKLAALGYANTPISQLEKSGEGKNEALYLNVTAKGADLQNSLQLAFEEAVKQLPIAKMMHYQVHNANGDLQDVEFARPVHRIVAMHGSHVLPIQVFGMTASNATEGHRFMSSGPIAIQSAVDYENTLEREGKVIASFSKRRQLIEAELLKAAQSDRVLMPDSLLDEVTALVEFPAIYTCHFDPEFLDVPQECLILTMQTNQKYFALTDDAGKLKNRFLIVSNIATQRPEGIISGNERVIRPRLSDARFFFQQDKKRSLESRIADLAKVVYHNQLGNQLERMGRVQAIAIHIANQIHEAGIGIDPKTVSRAAELAKTDLLSDMVGEFPELQGVMGQYYALADHEHPDVAAACSEHYLPRFAGDALPKTLVGTVLAIADKLETIMGIWAIGLIPTGDKDPFALRRHALGICRLLIEKNLPLDLNTLIGLAKNQFSGVTLKNQVSEEAIYQFILERLRAYLKDHLLGDKPYTVPEIESVLCMNPGKINDLTVRLEAVRSFNELSEATQLAAANKRISNILKKMEGKLPSEVQTQLLRLPAEINLLKSLEALSPKLDQQFKSHDFIGLLQNLVALSQPIDQFFSDVMVMDEDLQLRQNRIALLNQLHQKMNLVADIGKLA
jgi:glycyl-tRNA synthetase beta chain